MKRGGPRRWPRFWRILTYGFTAMFFEPDGSRLHGLNERIRTDVLYQGRDFLYDLVKTYAK